MATLDELIAEAKQRDRERQGTAMQKQHQEEQVVAHMRIQAIKDEIVKKFGAPFEEALNARHDVDSQLRGFSHFRYQGHPYKLYASERDTGRTYWTIAHEVFADAMQEVDEQGDLLVTRDRILLALAELHRLHGHRPLGQ